MFIDKEPDALYQRFASKVYEPELLDGKTKELIALACSVMADCVPCIEYHYPKAREQGASDAEIREAMAITMTVAAGSKQAKYWKLIGELSGKS
ncbi:MAG: carboxymuconolactone decarboxylase family protein [Gaiellaceae bacterium]|jgi:AhpD family alkylhydroperoxidase